MYTEEEVKHIIEHRENKIKEEYNKILHDLLEEQFNNFTMFNQDYISQRFKEKYVVYFY